MAGKSLGYVESFEEDGDLFIGIRFDDDTALTFTITPQTPKIANAELVKREHGESAVIKTYIKPKQAELPAATTEQFRRSRVQSPTDFYDAHQSGIANSTFYFTQIRLVQARKLG